MKKIIATEDIIRILKKEQSFLDRSGFALLPASSNEEILAVHKREKADLIAANLDSPSMSGEELCSVIRKDPEICAVSIIIICPSASDSDRCMACNANAFLPSDVSSAVLLQEMHRLLNIAMRGSCRVPVKIRLEGKKTKASFSGSIENISASGMLFSSDAELYEGDTITCSFSLPASETLTAEAEIVRIIEKKSQNKQTLYGISFTDPDNNLISAIERFINAS